MALEEQLLSACFDGDFDTVPTLLQPDVNINVQGPDQSTPLMSAAKQGHIEIVEILLLNNADVNMKKRNGNTALTLASWNGRPRVVELLIRYSADPNHVYHAGNNGLTVAAQKGHANVVEVLLKHKVDPNFTKSSGASSIMLAAQNGHVNVCEVLLKYKANVNHAKPNGTTALLLTATYGHLHAIELLLKHGANVNQPGNYGHTPLTIAAKNGFMNVVELLLKHGADVHHRNNGDDTAEKLAADFGHPHIRNFLKLKAGTFQVLLSNAQLSDVTHVTNRLYRGRISLPGVAMQVDIRIPDQHSQNLWTELNVIRNLSPHLNVQGFLGVCMDFECKSAQSKPAFVVPHIPGDNLEHFIHTTKATLSTLELVQLSQSIISAIRHVHDCHFILCSFSLSSFLLTSKLNKRDCVLSDLRHCRRIEIPSPDKTAVSNSNPPPTSTQQIPSIRGQSGSISNSTDSNQWNCAPEVLQKNEFSESSDVWTFGLLLWHLIFFSSTKNTSNLSSSDPSSPPSSRRPSSSISQLPFTSPKSVKSLRSPKSPKSQKREINEYLDVRQSLSDFVFHKTLPFDEESGKAGMIKGVTELVVDCCHDEVEARPSVQTVQDRLQALIDVEQQRNFDAKTTETSQSIRVLKSDLKSAERLVDAVKEAEIEKVEKLLDEGIDVNAFAAYQWTGLLAAVESGSLEMVKLLTDRGADVNHIERYGYSPLTLAARHRHIDVFKFLVDRGANVHTTNYPNAYSLWRCARVDYNLPMLKMLCENGFSKTWQCSADNSTAESKSTPRPEIVNYIELAPEGPFLYRTTMLMYAAWAGHLDVVNLIASYGVDINRKDSSGRNQGTGKTAIEYADEQKHTEVSEFLKSVKPHSMQAQPFQIQFFNFQSLLNLKPHSSNQYREAYTASASSLSNEVFKCHVSKTGNTENTLVWPELEVLKTWPEMDDAKNDSKAPNFLPSLAGLCMDFKTVSGTGMQGLQGISIVKPAILTNFCDGGSLKDVLSNYDQPLDNRISLKFAEEIAESIQYLHENDFIHRNICLQSFELTHQELDHPNQILKFSDLHLAKKLDKDHTSYTARYDDFLLWRWSPHETLSRGESGKSSDVFMLGITIWELFSDDTIPFSDCVDPKQKLDWFSKHKQEFSHSFKGHFPREIRSLIQQCCSFNESDRPTTAQILKTLKQIRSSQRSPPTSPKIAKSPTNSEIENLSPRQQKEKEKERGKLGKDKGKKPHLFTFEDQPFMETSSCSSTDDNELVPLMAGFSGKSDEDTRKSKVVGDYLTLSDIQREIQLPECEDKFHKS